MLSGRSEKRLCTPDAFAKDSSRIKRQQNTINAAKYKTENTPISIRARFNSEPL